MRYIKVPEPVALKNADRESIKFTEWMESIVLVDAKLGKTAKSLMATADILKKLEKTNGVLELTDAEWELLKPIVEEPSVGYNPVVGVQLVGFIRAFLHATDAEEKAKN